MDQRIWTDLVHWLHSHSTDTASFKASLSTSSDGNRSLVATEDILESTPILSLPPSALLNINTLPKEFVESCSSDLSSTQTLTLFLAIYRSKSRLAINSAATKDKDIHQEFIPYLLSLPDEFPGIPLVWILQSWFSNYDSVVANDRAQVEKFLRVFQSQNYSTAGNRPEIPLDRFMSTTTIKKSDQVARNFTLDWLALLNDIKNLVPDDDLLLPDLVWAWLVVNTRCVWYDLGCKKHEDNITLAPGFDMANHSPNSPVTTIATPHTLTLFSTYPVGGFNSPKTNQRIKSSKQSHHLTSHFHTNSKFKDRDKVQIQKGHEITFSYGPHSNSTLFVEYGFIIIPHHPPADHFAHPHLNPWDSIDISDTIQNLISLVDTKSDIVSTLERSGYWGNYTIDCKEPIELGSYRTLVALRLLCSPEEGHERWQEHVEGKIDDLGGEIECKVWTKLHIIFVDLVSLTKDLVERIQDRNSSQLVPLPYSRQCLLTLARNELFYLSSFVQQTSKIIALYHPS